MKDVFRDHGVCMTNSPRHDKELTDFGLLGNLSVNVSVSQIQHSESNVDYFWNSEATPNKTITIHADGIAQIIIDLSEVKTFKEGQLVPAKADRSGIENSIKKTITVIL
jgi:hypothetical protein